MKRKIYALILFVCACLGALTSCVEYNRATYIEIEGSADIELEVGASTKLMISTDGNANRMEWYSSNVSIATVSDDGTVTAEREGMATVVVSLGNLMDAVTVHVTKDTASVIPPDSIDLELSSTTIYIGEYATLTYDVFPDKAGKDISFFIKEGDNCVSFVGNKAKGSSAGTVDIVGVIEGVESNPVTLTVINSDVNKYDNTSESEFYANYTVASSNTDAYYRTQMGFMSGSLTVPDQEPMRLSYQPTKNGTLVKNTAMYYSENGNAYTVLDVNGDIAFTVYKDGAYITLEEVAAYVWAFGDVPKNYASGKSMDPDCSVWGEYLRLNHSKFSGNTSKYPYEPVLPNISGCGGDFDYYEIDIGTTGTDCDLSYSAAVYNNGSTITRGAARIVYARFDANGNKIIDPAEKYVFYTYNHYNDFQEYLNYFGGWGNMFGNITGGGTLSSKYDYNPTPYIPVYNGEISAITAMLVIPYYDDKRIAA